MARDRRTDRPTAAEQLDFAWKAHEANVAWVRNVDQKASIVLVFSTALAGVAANQSLTPNGPLAHATGLKLAVTIATGVFFHACRAARPLRRPPASAASPCKAARPRRADLLRTAPLPQRRRHRNRPLATHVLPRAPRPRSPARGPRPHRVAQTPPTATLAQQRRPGRRRIRARALRLLIALHACAPTRRNRIPVPVLAGGPARAADQRSARYDGRSATPAT